MPMDQSTVLYENQVFDFCEWWARDYINDPTNNTTELYISQGSIVKDYYDG